MKFKSRNIRLAFMLSVGIVATLFSSLTGNTHAFDTAKKAAPKQQAQQTFVKRQDNLDHWDSETLAYYLDNYPGYDLAVMFYATWDNNSHRLAPMWNQIAALMDAGTTQSKLIMSLFDCELNSVHIELCTALGITHYPTMMFIGSGPFYDNDPISKFIFGKKSGGQMGESHVPNTVKFQGNWQYGDAIMDWIKTMQALSRWHIWSTEGLGKRLRTFFLPKKQENAQLPLGVPVGAKSSSSSSSSSSATSSSADVAFLEQEVEKYKKSAKEMKQSASKSATMIEALYFNENSTDMFTYLDEHGVWENYGKYENLNDIYRVCVIELAYDYCDRLHGPAGDKVVNELINSELSQEELLEVSKNAEKLVTDEVAKKEPYCGIIDHCIVSSFKDVECRRKTCPFNNEPACRVLSSCMEKVSVKEYADALNLDVDALN